MDNLGSNWVCAFCTTIITDNRDTGFLQTFHSEFITNSLFQINSANSYTNNLPDNWSICENCLPQIQLLLESKQKVDKFDSEVRNLQNKILTEMKSLLGEVNKMCGEMVTIEGILRSNPVIPKATEIKKGKKKRGRKKLSEEEKMTAEFRKRIFNVLQDLQIFSVETSNKLLLKRFSSKTLLAPSSSSSPSKPELLPVPSNPRIKIEVDNQEDMDMWVDTEENYAMSPPNSPPPQDSPPTLLELPSVFLPPPPDDIDEGQGQPVHPRRKRKTVPLQKPADYEGLDLTSSSDEETREDYEDFEFHPKKPISVKLTKKIGKYSFFRKSLLSRIHERSTIATSADLPPSSDDPRRPFCIKYNGKTEVFSINDIQFNILDNEETLQCSQCDYSINSKNCISGSRGKNIEDFIFDHILAKHLNAFNCKVCGKSYPNGTKFLEHLKAHNLEFSCDICQKPLFTGSGLKRHKWTHLSEEEKGDPKFADWMPSEAKNKNCFQCETCGKAFKRVRNLRDHEITHLDTGEREKDKVMCTDCGKLVFPASLKTHQRSWCEKVRGPPRGVDCEVCGENVKTLRELHEHLKERHPGERIWGCETCGGRFRTKWHLRAHEKVHRDGYQFICERCGRGFKSKKNKKRHEGTCKGAGGGGGGD